MTASRGEAASYDWLVDFDRSLAVWRKVLGVAGAALCHDLNNPLQGVVGFADLLVQTVQNDDLRSDLQVILEGGLACRRLADGFGELAEEFGPEAEDVGLDDLSRKVLFPTVPEDKWRLDIPERLRIVHADPLYLALVLRGLCSMGGKETTEARLGAHVGEEAGEVWLSCELVQTRVDPAGSGPQDLEYWLGRRAARLLGGGMDRSIEDGRVVSRAWMPGLVEESHGNGS